MNCKHHIDSRSAFYSTAALTVFTPTRLLYQSVGEEMCIGAGVASFSSRTAQTNHQCKKKRSVFFFLGNDPGLVFTTTLRNWAILSAFVILRAPDISISVGDYFRCLQIVVDRKIHLSQEHW